MPRIDKGDFLEDLPRFSEAALEDARLAGGPAPGEVVVALDDDPTGIQTVHGVDVHMDWTMETLAEPIANDRLFFIHTNTRAFPAERAAAVNREIATNVLRKAAKAGKRVTLLSRGDSTLRGHYPLETRILREVYERETGERVDGEIIVPFFEEGGRFTANDIHYVAEGETLVPAGETEFAKDATFGYSSSDLKEYVIEKHGGDWPRDKILSVSLEAIRQGGSAAVRSMRQRPSYVVAKGGITSSDLAVKGMGVRRERILGQALPGVPLVRLDPESKWGGMPYVIFPGNVGDEQALLNVVTTFDKARRQPRAGKGTP